MLPRGDGSADLSLLAVEGKRLMVFWPLDARFYIGRVVKENKVDGKCLVEYEDDDTREWLDLRSETFQWLDGIDVQSPEASCHTLSPKEVRVEGGRHGVITNSDAGVFEAERIISRRNARKAGAHFEYLVRRRGLGPGGWWVARDSGLTPRGRCEARARNTQAAGLFTLAP